MQGDTIAINLLAPMRLNNALIPHFLTKDAAFIMTVSSGLAFLPAAMFPTYSATKAAIHSYSQSLRYQLKGSPVTVLELAPPYVQTHLTGPHQATDPNAMPLGDFVDEVMSILKEKPDARVTKTHIPQELIDLAHRYSDGSPVSDTPLEGLKIVRREQRTGPMHSLYEPCICFVVQGEKLVTVGSKRYRCEPSRFFAAASNVPVVGEVLRASPESPYMCLVLNLDQKVIYELVQKTGPLQIGSQEVGVFTDEATGPLTDAFLRLLRTLDNENDRRVLSPLIIREIVYYLMKSRFAHVIYQLGVRGSRLHRIFGSIEKIRRDFASPLRVDSLARMADMSPSAFHQHFKKVTLLSPIQFQKHVRLQEARRLLATEVEDVTSVAFMVGYESHSQFSREYARLFGMPPSKDIKNLQSLYA